nr:hypothetical protein [Kibdelosporangium sp. MJ126-NF4]
MRRIAVPFTVAAPAGARIRDRLRVSVDDEKVLSLMGRELGRHARADLADRVRIGDVPQALNQRARRKKALTLVSSSRWAGTITRTSEDQYQLAMRCLRDERTSLRRAIGAISARLSVTCGQRHDRVRGYTNRNERWQKQRRLALLKSRLAKVEFRIEKGHPAIVLGGRQLAKTRHNLDAARLGEDEWRNRWDAARVFLTADGESGAPFGNYTITVTPDGRVSVVLPESLRYLANMPRGRYRLSCEAGFSYRRDEWLDRVGANRAVRYDIKRDPLRGRWYIDASWSSEKTVLPTPVELADSGARLLGVDLNADHLAACVTDAYGNPAGQPHTIRLDLTGSATTRDGQLRQAISKVIHLARQHRCAGFAIENLGFADARAVGRETLGRGQRGRRFRRTVHGIPSARFRERLRGMAFHADLLVIAVDPAYTSQWGAQYWRRSLQRQTTNGTATRHHAAAVAIARRACGYGLRRRPGVTLIDQRIGKGRATGQAASRLRGRGNVSPPRTPGSLLRGR